MMSTNPTLTGTTELKTGNVIAHSIVTWCDVMMILSSFTGKVKTIDSRETAPAKKKRCTFTMKDGLAIESENTEMCTSTVKFLSC